MEFYLIDAHTDPHYTSNIVCAWDITKFTMTKFNNSVESKIDIKKWNALETRFVYRDERKLYKQMRKSYMAITCRAVAFIKQWSNNNSEKKHIGFNCMYI